MISVESISVIVSNRGKLIKFSLLTSILLVSGCSVKTKQLALPATTSDVIHVRDYGAIPNDQLDDARAIQEAVNDMLRTGRSALIKFEPGIYDLEKGIVVSNMQSNGEYSFITCQLSGHVPGFSPEQRFGATTVFNSKTPGFALAVQLGRNCLIENIVFTGQAVLLNSSADILSYTKELWEEKGNSRINRYSPHCAIAIDPFHQNVPQGDQYPGMNTYYTNESSGGSSMVTIRGCSFYRFYIAIANNPSNGVSNGDNIFATQCHVSNCHTFWSAGQTQSRNNQVDNIYALSINTFVSGVEIGKQIGTPPGIHKVNIAGFCKYVFNIRSYFSGIHMSDSYLESIWSLGIAVTHSVSIDQCQIVFRNIDKELFSPPFHLYTTGVAYFKNCGLEYFANCQIPAPIVLRSDAIAMEGGWIEGGVVTAEGITNEGGDDLQNISLKNVVLKCQGSTAGGSSYKRPIEKLANEVMQGEEVFKSYDHSVFTHKGDTYKVIPLGKFEVQIDAKSKEAKFISDQPGRIKEGDNIYTLTNLQADADDNLIRIRPALGYVKSIAGNTITVAGIPLGLISSAMDLYLVDYSRFLLPVWGTVEVGKKTITNIEATSSSYYPKPGMRLLNAGFAEGSYIVSVNVNSRTIEMSTPAISSKKNHLLKNGIYTQDLYLDAWQPERVNVLIEGATIYLQEPFNQQRRFVNTSMAIQNSVHRPVLAPIQ